jgi:hypothetical protein
MEDLTELRTLLEERELVDERFADYPGWVNAIIALRQQTGQTPQNTSDASRLAETVLGTGAGAAAVIGNTDGKIKSWFELVGTQGSPFIDDPDEMNGYMPMLYDNLMISDMPVVGRININQAPRTVLEVMAAQEDELSETAALASAGVDALLGTTLTQMNVGEIIEGILAERISDPYLTVDFPEMNYPFWVYTHGIITDLTVMKQLEPYFCAQGAVFKATVVGRFDEKSPVSRVEVWLDSAEGDKLPKVIRIRDISELGPGYAAELLNADPYVR